jgi:hypothetical protein
MSSSPLFTLSFYHTVASGLLAISKASTMAHMRPLRVTDFEYALARTRKAGIWLLKLFSASCCRDLVKEFIRLPFKFLLLLIPITTYIICTFSNLTCITNLIHLVLRSNWMNKTWLGDSANDYDLEVKLEETHERCAIFSYFALSHLVMTFVVVCFLDFNLLILFHCN